MFATIVSCFVLLTGGGSSPAYSASAVNLVKNGSFETDADDDGAPDAWSTAGRQEIEQTLTLAVGHDGKRAAKLTCTKFVGGTPDSHAMLCQVGHIGVKRGQWYRLSFWVKGTGIAHSVGNVALSKTKPWGASGIATTFAVTSTWRHVEKTCQATADVPAEYSRLQFWFASTGTLWLDDVTLTPVDTRVEFHPQLATVGVRNLIPNSSFECGGVGWGSYIPNLTSWSGNAYRLLGEVDASTAFHGRRSLRVTLDERHPLMYRWDYFDAVNQPIDSVLTGHVGWVPVQPHTRFVLSCYLKADSADTPAVLLVRQSSGGALRRSVTVDVEWKRYSFSFTPTASFLWTAVGLDLSNSDLQTATLWLDAVQLERAETPSPYTPRAMMESGIATPAVGNLFADPDQGLAVDVVLWNSDAAPRTAAGRLAVTDFFDREVASRRVTRRVPSHTAVAVHLTGLLKGKRGFFRVHWRPAGHRAPYPQTLRCAVVDPYPAADSPFGMNHAYPWPFLLRLSKQAGLTWMRDWSVKWHTVEPTPGHWQFAATDPQIDRVLAEKLQVLLLLPFPSAPWSSSADAKVIDRAAGHRPYLKRRYVVACPAKDPALFRAYVARTVQHYRNRVTWYEIMNEPVYTTYAVPARFGYGLGDYLRVLRDAYQTVKANQRDAQVIGGIATWADHRYVHQFIEEGGLQWCDAMNLHLYPATIPPESYEGELAQCRELMEARNQVKPLWLTEFGCYADDDPYRTPPGIGDSAMSRANWPSERAAAEALVKTAAVFLTHGVEKIFYHAGTCGPLNGQDGGGIFFEYGGTPRKMYAALNVLADMLGPHPRPLPPPVVTKDVRAYLFQTPTGVVAIAWADDANPSPLSAGDKMTAKDMMGNALPRAVDLTATPVYVSATKPAALRKALREGT